MEKKIKVAIAVNDLGIGGAQKLAIDQLVLLDRNIFSLSLLVLGPSVSREDFFSQIPSDVPVYRLNFHSFWDIGEWVFLIKVLIVLRPDVVKTSLFFSNTILRVLQPFFGYVCIAAEHNTDHKKSRVQIFVDRLLMRLTCTMVVDSIRVAKFLSETEHVSRDKFTVIYNGVDTDAVRESIKNINPKRKQIRGNLGIPSNAKVFLNISRLVGQKNHALMIDAFAKVAEEHDNARLIIVGNGGFMDKLKQQASNLGVKDKIIFTGEQKDLHQFYIASDYFIVTSLHEGFCIVAMEGLAFGMPLIATKVAGISEYLKDCKNGFFVEYNPEDVAQKMQKVIGLSQEERRAFSEEGKQTAENYSLHRYKEEYTKLLLRCAGE